MSAETRRIRSLDGLRTLSVGLVILNHVASNGLLGDDVAKIPWFRMGSLGVDIFFGISGYIITVGLLASLRQGMSNGAVFRDFYIKRAFRILPALWLYCGAIAILSAAGAIKMDWAGIASALTFTRNLGIDFFEQRIHAIWLLGHTWSLSVEEQFYLLWPAVFLLLMRKRAHLLLPFLYASIGIAPFVQVASTVQHNVTGLLGFLLHISNLAAGCALAVLLEQDGTGTKIRNFLRDSGAAGSCAVVCIVAVLTLHFAATHGRWPYVTVALRGITTSIGVAYFIGYAMFRPNAVTSVLNLGPVAFIGEMSYGIYLWQQLFTDGSQGDITAIWMQHTNQFPVNFLLIGLLSYGSFRFLEQPLLQVRRRFLHSKPPHLNMAKSHESARIAS